MAQKRAQVEACFAKVLTSIQQGLDARRIVILKDGTQIDAGPDHYVRLAAAKQFLKFMAGWPVPEAKPEKEAKRKPTWEEFVGDDGGARLLQGMTTSPWAVVRTLRCRYPRLSRGLGFGFRNYRSGAGRNRPASHSF